MKPTKQQKTDEIEAIIRNVLNRISDRIMTAEDLNYVLDKIDALTAKVERLEGQAYLKPEPAKEQKKEKKW